MARSSTTIKKGQVLNPSGAPKIPDELKMLMRATSLQAKRDIHEVYNLSLKDLRATLDGPDFSAISAGKAMIMSCINNCIVEADSKVLSVFLDRILGKPKEVVEIEDKDGETVSTKDQLIGQFVSMLMEKK